ncbi:hypothetical protein GGX14DRAFT_481714 [Mycena pura]|uniref:Uncharacterized protein n=1 Tax=Mycena pura TaxID=153505 RepID=A0AAD6Y2A9_9AGAR|nr:hypothetical protein GGX14DRAFT_481714 [Mycena pura]
MTPQPQECIATVDARATHTCRARTVENMNWCPRHNEERIKLYTDYKSWQASLRKIETQSDVCTMEDIKACNSINAIKGWNESIRARFGLLTRCIQAREQFTKRFFGDDMDFGHRAYCLSLVKRRNELESLLARLEGRGYDLLLESQNAAWVRDQEVSFSDCSEHRGDVESTPQEPTDASLQNLDDLDLELTALQETAVLFVWKRVRYYIATFMLPTSSRFYEERKRVVWALICRIIYKDPKLMLLALNYEDVPSFLSDPGHDFDTGDKLENRLVHIPPGEARAAIDDVLRPADERSEYVTVLGIRLYKAASGLSMSLHAWGHIFALRVCLGCIRSVCTSVEEMIECQRYALFTGSAPFRDPGRPNKDPIPASAVLTICGLVFEFPDTGKHVSVSKHVAADGTITWEEKKCSPMLSAALSRADPQAHVFLNALLRHCLGRGRLAVILCKKLGEPVVRSAPVIAGCFLRSAPSLAGLRGVPSMPCAVFADSLVDVAEPFAGCRTRRRAPLDCMRLIVLDNETGDGGAAFLVDELVAVCRAMYEDRTPWQLAWAIAAPYLAQGELELDPEGQRLIPNTENMYTAHKDLWGTTLDFDWWPWPGEVPDSKLFPTIWTLAEQM